MEKLLRPQHPVSELISEICPITANEEAFQLEHLLITKESN